MLSLSKLLRSQNSSIWLKVTNHWANNFKPHNVKDLFPQAEIKQVIPEYNHEKLFTGLAKVTFASEAQAIAADQVKSELTYKNDKIFIDLVHQMTGLRVITDQPLTEDDFYNSGILPPGTKVEYQFSEEFNMRRKTFNYFIFDFGEAAIADDFFRRKLAGEFRDCGISFKVQQQGRARRKQYNREMYFRNGKMNYGRRDFRRIHEQKQRIKEAALNSQGEVFDGRKNYQIED